MLNEIADNVMQKSIVSLFLKSFFTIALMLVGFSAFAQGQFTVKLKLVDEKTSEPVPFATASLTVKGEEKAAKYVLTDDKGQASLTKVKKGTYIVKAELMGYKAFQQEVVVDKDIDLGNVKMAEDAEILDAASVSAAGNPIIIKKDTIEYNASSFKTSDNDMLEELLKKLPGVEVGTDGSITANGETIKKITIDGKTFFLDDPQLATKNIPAKIVNKVKVVEKKSEQAEFTGIDDGNEETIIDLSIRQGMMNGMFGNVMAGGGRDIPSPTNDMNDWRYQGAAMVGRFTDKSQISVILNANNTNNRGFNDMAGSMMQGMRGGGGGMGRGGGGWGGGNGITTSWMGGLNGAFTFFDGDMELAGNYLYNGSDKFVQEESTKTTFLEDGSRLIYDNSGHSKTMTQGHRFGVRLEHKFSKNTSILFEPQVNFGGGRFNEFSSFETFGENDGSAKQQKNDGYTSSNGDNKNWSTSGFLLFRQRIGKPGRTVSANVRYSFSNNDMTGLNQSLTNAYTESSEQAKPEIVNQYFDRNSKSASLSGRMVYTEPLAEKLFLEANYEYSWSRSESIKDTYNSASDKYTSDGFLIYDHVGAERDEIYSSEIINRYVNQRGGLTLSWQDKNLRANVGAGVTPTNTHNETNGESYDSKVVNWAPQAMVFYTINDNTNLRLFYNGRSAQPSTSQLMRVPDNSNPMSISFGNIYLKPYFNHNIRANFGYTNKQSFTSVHANIRGGIVQNAITNAQWYDQKGVQYSMPVNGPGTGNLNGSVMVNSPFGKSDFSIFSMTNVGYNQSTSYIGTGKLDNYYNSETAEFKYDEFHKDFPTLDGTKEFSTNKTQSMNLMQRIRLTYRNDFVELTASGRTRMNKSWYTIASATNTTTWSNQVGGSMNWTIPGGLNLISSVNYNWYNGYTTPQEDEIIMNAEITQLLFKRTCTIAIKAYDIFAQSKNLSVTDASNYHQEVRNNTLGRYIILSFTYRFGTFSGNRGGGRGMGGPMGGRGPMGGPMGGGMRR